MRRVLSRLGPTMSLVGAAVVAVRAEVYTLAMLGAFAALAWAGGSTIRAAIQGGDTMSPPSPNRGRPRPMRRMPNIITGGIR